GFASIVKAVMPNIVMVQATGKVKGQQYNYIGSGFIIEGNYIVTNAHVIGTNPNQITVRFESSIDEKTYMVKPVYVESGYDLAILEFTGLAKNKFSGLEHLTLRLDPAFGEEAYTVGNPKGFDFSVSKCVISNPKREYKYRDVDEVIQIDMTVNPGNSGGALLDMNNNVLGVITFYPGGINGGIAMCIPSKYIVNILNKL
ncbi:MAG: S1C family serine protease, partial [Clostridia bacterium]|nr:S1C family serine protease [Clostridia bacterium]